MKLGDFFILFRDTFKEWSKDKASRLGAALAYYAIFAIGPLLLVTIAIAGIVFGSKAAQGQIVAQIRGQVGSAGAQVIESAVQNASKPSSSLLASVIGVIILLVAAAGIFGQLKDSLNTIWKVEPVKGGIKTIIIQNLLNFLMVLIVGVLLIASLAASTAISVFAKPISDVIPGGAILLGLLNYVVSFLIIVVLFASLFKVLPDTSIAWREVWFGSAVTAVLFILGQFLLSIYFGFSNVGSPYGAAASLVLILVWIYYSAQIVLFGAEFTWLHAKRYGPRAVEKAARKEAAARSPWFAS